MSKFISEFGNDDEVSDELYLARLRNWRNKELKESDWTQVSDSPVDKNLWAIYRQELRNLPQQQENPRNIELPVKPD